ncbi:MAG: hypothetical protein ACE5HV_13065, partial [Acidobacteriota bacterium]
YLEVLDRRDDAARARINHLNEVLDGLLDTLRVLSSDAAVGEGEPGARGSFSDAVETMRGALQCAVEALAADLSLQEKMQQLVDAKDAETLQRAAAGPLRRMELVFDEFARQQEALIAELVGRRQHLDALIEQLESSTAPTVATTGAGVSAEKDR